MTILLMAVYYNSTVKYLSILKMIILYCQDKSVFGFLLMIDINPFFCNRSTIVLNFFSPQNGNEFLASCLFCIFDVTIEYFQVIVQS